MFVHLELMGSQSITELIKAFKTLCFPNAIIYLHCTNHLRQNVKDKLRNLGFFQNVAE